MRWLWLFHIQSISRFCCLCFQNVFCIYFLTPLLPLPAISCSLWPGLLWKPPDQSFCFPLVSYSLMLFIQVAACGHMVGLYFSTAFEVRYVQMICFSQWDVSGSDVRYSQTDVAEPGCESPCSLFPVTWLPTVIQMESAPSLGPRRRKGGAERWLTYNGCEVWVRSSLCSCKTQHFCGCPLPSCFTGLGKLRSRDLILCQKSCQIAVTEDDLACTVGCTYLIFLSANSSWNHPFKHPSGNVTQNF